MRDIFKDLAATIRALPPRPTEIHQSPCAQCPTVACARAGIVDLESEEIKETYPRHEQVDSVFRCAWRPEKLCKGYCDYLNVTEDDLK